MEKSKSFKPAKIELSLELKKFSLELRSATESIFCVLTEFEKNSGYVQKFFIVQKEFKAYIFLKRSKTGLIFEKLILSLN